VSKSRLVVIVDALRVDTAAQIVMPSLSGATLGEARSFGTWTKPAFAAISSLMAKSEGVRIVMTGGGWPQKIEWRGVAFVTVSLSPCINDLEFVASYAGCENCLLVLHDFHVHQYFIEYPGYAPSEQNKKDKDRFWSAYTRRAREVAPRLETVLQRFDGWDRYVTADHSELFWEDGKSFHHGKPAEGNEGEVRRVPLIRIGDAPELAYDDLFSLGGAQADTEQRLRALGYID